MTSTAVTTADVYPFGMLVDEETGTMLRAATAIERDESISAGPRGYIWAMCYRVRPYNADPSRGSVYDYAGDGNCFPSYDEAESAAESLDKTLPLDGGEWLVDRIKLRAFVVAR